MKHPLLSLGEDMLRGIAAEVARERATRTEEETQDLQREANLGIDPEPPTPEEIDTWAETLQKCQRLHPSKPFTPDHQGIF